MERRGFVPYWRRMTRLERVHGLSLAVLCGGVAAEVLCGVGGWGLALALLSAAVATVTQPDHHPADAPAPALTPEPPRNRRRVDLRA